MSFLEISVRPSSESNPLEENSAIGTQFCFEDLEKKMSKPHEKIFPWLEVTAGSFGAVSIESTYPEKFDCKLREDVTSNL